MRRLQMIGQRYPFPATPNGWFAVSLSGELTRGQVKPLRCFGQDLVLFRTEDGTAHVFDAYCPHLGAHFGYGGSVVGQTLRCPFHHWCFDASGACVEAPFVEKIPPLAKTKPWPVHETDGVILVYYHAERAEPTWTPPTQLSPAWTPIQWNRWRDRFHIQEVAENTADATHVLPVHGYLRPTKISDPREEGAFWRVRWDVLVSSEYAQALATETIGGTDLDPPLANGPVGTADDGTLNLYLDISLYGLGIVEVASPLIMLDWPILARFYLTPIDDEEIEFTMTVSALAPEGTDSEVAEAVVANLLTRMTRDTRQDNVVFRHKAYLQRPALTPMDGPIMRVRRWARQFYSGIDAIPQEPATGRLSPGPREPVPSPAS